MKEILGQLGKLIAEELLKSSTKESSSGSKSKDLVSEIFGKSAGSSKDKVQRGGGREKGGSGGGRGGGSRGGGCQ